MDHPLPPKGHVLRAVEQAVGLASELGQPDVARRVAPALERYRLGLFRLLVAGEIKRGKSSFINALLGEPDLLPTSSDVATSTVYKVAYGPERAYKAFRLDPDGGPPTPLAIGPEEVAAYGTEDGNPGNEKGIAFIGVELPHPLLKAGLVLIDTPGLGGLFKEHGRLFWEHAPQADAAAFVLDSHEAVVSAPEAEVVVRLAALTPHLVFVQTKTDLVEEAQWAQWRRRNLDVLAERLGRAPEALPYFPVSSELKALADRRGSPHDLDRSGFGPLLAYVHGELLQRKEHLLAQELLRAASAELDGVRAGCAAELQALLAETQGELDRLEEAYRDAQGQVERWRSTEYQQLLARFQEGALDHREELLNRYHAELDFSLSGPAVRAAMDEVRAAGWDARLLKQKAPDVQNACTERCLALAFDAQRAYSEQMQALIEETAQALGATYTARVDDRVDDVALPAPTELHLLDGTFERARNAVFGGGAGLTVASWVLGGATGGIAWIVGLAAAAYAVKRSDKELEDRRREEALRGLQQLLMERVRTIQQHAVRQGRKIATEYERAARRAFEEAVARTRHDLQERLRNVAEARSRTHEENRARAAALRETIQRLDDAVQGLRGAHPRAGAHAEPAVEPA